MMYDVATPRFGDIICVYRGPTKHFGVYVNDYSVIHYAPYVDEFANYRCIRETTLDHFVHSKHDYYVCIFPRIDQQAGRLNIAAAPYGTILPLPRLMRLSEFFLEHRDCSLYSPEETAERALSKVGDRAYDDTTSNCEHFVVWCKTGICDKPQVKTLISLLPIVPIHYLVH